VLCCVVRDRVVAGGAVCPFLSVVWLCFLWARVWWLLCAVSLEGLFGFLAVVECRLCVACLPSCGLLVRVCVCERVAGFLSMFLSA